MITFFFLFYQRTRRVPAEDGTREEKFASRVLSLLKDLDIIAERELLSEGCDTFNSSIRL